MDTWTLIRFLLGLVLLVGGAEFLVRGASRFAVSIGVSPLVVGLTVVAFGTSAPEMAVSALSALRGNPDIAIGNVVGSNIFNVLLILGLSALVGGLVVAQRLVRLEVPLLVVLSTGLWIVLLDRRISRVEAAVMFAGVLAYTAWTIRQSRRETASIEAEYAEGIPSRESGLTDRLVDVGLMVSGLAALVVGSNWLVEGAVAIAERLGASELIIGLTIVSAGTSLPELATSVVAALRGQRDIAVGNVVGSNIFNLLAVLGLGGLVAPAALTAPDVVVRFDIPIMIAVAVACIPIFFTGHRISRLEGGVMVGFYALYIAYLIFDATDAGAPSRLNAAVWIFVIPLTVIGLGVATVRQMKGS